MGNRKGKLSPRQIDAMLAEYDALNLADPDGPSVNDVASRFGISRQTLYYHLNNRIRRESEAKAAGRGEADATIQYLMDEVFRLKSRVKELEAELADAGH